MQTEYRFQLMNTRAMVRFTKIYGNSCPNAQGQIKMYLKLNGLRVTKVRVIMENLNLE
nr:MAG TPA: hypothetical protein [Caudoviricetes sp.]